MSTRDGDERSGTLNNGRSHEIHGAVTWRSSNTHASRTSCADTGRMHAHTLTPTLAHTHTSVQFVYVFVYAKQANQTRRVSRMGVRAVCGRCWMLLGEYENVSHPNLIVKHTKPSINSLSIFFSLICYYLWRHPFSKRTKTYSAVYLLLFIWLLSLYLYMWFHIHIFCVDIWQFPYRKFHFASANFVT